MGGNGGGATNNSVAEFKPPSWTEQGWKDYVNQGTALSSRPYTQYTGQQIAGPNDFMNAASDSIWQRSILGAPDLNSARGSMTDVVNGSRANNPWLSNDYTQAVINQNAQAMGAAHATGTAAQNDAMAVRSGQYGSSGWGLKQAQDASALQSNVGKMANELQLGRMQQGANDYQQGTNAMLGAAGQIGQLSQDDWTSAKNLMGVGDAQRQYTQDLLNQQKGDWEKQQMYGYSQLDAMGNILSRASGGYGTNVATNSTGYQTSPWTGLLGGAAAGYGAYKAFSP
jgi:hypothetical protein